MFSSLFKFFSTESVKQKIQTNTMSQTQLFIYFYLITLFDFIGSTQQSLSLIGRSPNIIDYLNIWENPAIAAVGLIFLYLVNGGGKGTEFLKKYFSFSFTVGIKYYFVFIILLSFPNYFSTLASSYYEIPVNIIVNIVMVANIALRIHQTKTSV